MEMTASEIVRRYNSSAYKSKQLQILADLNCCSKEDIEKILEENGVVISSVVKNKIVRTPSSKDKVSKPLSKEDKCKKRKEKEVADFKQMITAQKERDTAEKKAELKQERVSAEIKENGITASNFDLVVPEIILETLESKIKHLSKKIEKYTKEIEELQSFVDTLRNSK